jgi:hypothetical protein
MSLSGPGLRAAALAFSLVMVGTVVQVAPARAEDLQTLEVTGEADEGASDSRGVAVDAAFAQATEDALADLVDKARRSEKRAVLNKEVIGRARRWVASYKVTGDQVAGGKRQLNVTVRINRELLKARLVELGVLEAGGAADPGEPADGPRPAGEPASPDDGPSSGGQPSSAPAASSSADPRWAGRTATLLLRARNKQKALVTFGASGEASPPGASAASAVMAERGLVVKPASLAGPAPREGEGDELPLDDGQARALAGSSKAELAVVVGVELSERQFVRGVATPMVLARAKARVVARGEGAEGEGSGSWVAVAGDGDRLAVDRAVAMAVAAALPTTAPGRAAPPALTTDDRPLPSAEGGAWLRISARTQWTMVTALLKQFAKQQGATAELRRFSPAGYLLLVRGPNADRAAAIARAAPLPEGAGALKVRTDRGVVTVRVEGP